MLNFTVGPVQSNETVRKIGGEQVPYFRTSEFSEIMLENERLVNEFVNAPENSRVCFMTCSGTGSMEAAVSNCFTEHDNVIVINGGSFGHRFEELLEIHTIPHTTVHLDPGKQITKADLDKACINGPYTGLVINVHETSTGVHYDIDMIADFCTEHNLFFIIDAISSFLCDELDMSKLGADIVITGSQKALACQPGISLIVLSPEAQRRVMANRTKCMYLDLKSALKNGERGQTPFTPAVAILLQINGRLREIKSCGGVNTEIDRCAKLAEDFRHRIAGLPLEIASESLSNAVTPLHPLNASAHEVFLRLKDEYGIWICPNGGEMKDKIFRVGHIGDLTEKDNANLVKAFQDMHERGLL